MSDHNALRWDGGPGHYEVHYLSLTDRTTGTGVWLRSTMRAPLDGPAECSLWCMAMDRDGLRLARKGTWPIDRLVAETDPFRLAVADSELTDHGYRGAFEDVAWDLSWTPTLPAVEHVHPLLRRARIAKTVLVLPHPDLAVSGTIRLPDRELVLDGARGGQAHLWGTKHALRWAWVHTNDLATADGAPAPEAYVDAVSVVVPRFGREVGPSTPVVARVLGEDLMATAPLTVLRAPSAFGLDTWAFEAVAGRRKLVCTVEAPRASLVGVTYDDPDGEQVRCYNSEVATMRVEVHDRAARRAGWVHRETLVADGTAHFESAQREPVPGVELQLA